MVRSQSIRTVQRTDTAERMQASYQQSLTEYRAQRNYPSFWKMYR